MITIQEVFYGKMYRPAVVDDDVDVGPRLKLPLPVADGGERYDDEERTAYPEVDSLLEEGDGLNRLTQTHLIRQDAVLSEKGTK